MKAEEKDDSRRFSSFILPPSSFDYAAIFAAGVSTTDAIMVSPISTPKFTTNCAHGLLAFDRHAWILYVTDFEPAGTVASKNFFSLPHPPTHTNDPTLSILRQI